MNNWERVNKLGFYLVDHDEEICALIFENPDADQRISIDYDPDCFGKDPGLLATNAYFIHSTTMNTTKDWFGQEIVLPCALTRDEMLAFVMAMDMFIIGGR